MTAEALIDTNILVYAFDEAERAKQKKAKKFMEEKFSEKSAVLSAQNLAEFHSISTRKIERPIRKELAQEIIREFSASYKIINYNEKTVQNAIQIEIAFRVHFWDALLAATMQENNLTTIYTENIADFGKISWIKAVNPLK